jgi:P-type conjugative transfer protein TrbJ
MKKLKFKLVVTAMASAMLLQAVPTQANGVTGVASEVTQVANNLLLGSQLATQLQQTTTQIAMWKTMLTNLLALPQNIVNQVTQPVRDVIGQVTELQTAYVGLKDSVKEVGTIWQRRNKEMINWGENPKEYFRKEKIMADKRGGQYKAQWDSDIAAATKLATRAKSVQTMAAAIPGITGNVQGLQLLNSQLNVVATSINELLVVVRKTSTNELQDRMNTEEANMIENDRKSARLDAMKEAVIRHQNVKSGFKAPWEK